MSPRPERKPGLGHSSNEAPVPSRPSAPQTCFIRESGTAAMCFFHTLEGAVWTLPLNHFSAAQGDEEGQRLRLIFMATEVRLEGRHLDKITEAIARGQGFRVCAVPPPFSSQYEGEVFVSLVRVSGAEDEEEEP